MASSSTIQGQHQQSVFGHSCHLHESAVFENSLVMDGGSVGAQSVVKGSVLGRNVHVGISCRIEGCVIGDGVTIEDGEHVLNQRIPNNS